MAVWRLLPSFEHHHKWTKKSTCWYFGVLLSTVIVLGTFEIFGALFIFCVFFSTFNTFWYYMLLQVTTGYYKLLLLTVCYFEINTRSSPSKNILLPLWMRTKDKNKLDGFNTGTKQRVFYHTKITAAIVLPCDVT